MVRLDRRISKAFLLGALVGLLFFRPPTAVADHLPGTPYRGDDIYVSEGLDPLEVTLRLDNQSPRAAQLRIPRGYVFWAELFSAPEYPELPPKLTADSIRIAAYVPTSQPYYSEFRRLIRAKAIKAPEELRQDTAIVGLIYVVGNNLIPREKLLVRNSASAERFDGLRVVTISNKVIYYSDRGEAEFVQARCAKNPNPIQKCFYEFLVCKHILANASLPDLRRHGRTAAEQQVRTVKNLIKPWIKSCD